MAFVLLTQAGWDEFVDAYGRRFFGVITFSAVKVSFPSIDIK